MSPTANIEMPGCEPQFAWTGTYESSYVYRVYGLNIRSEIRLASLRESSESGPADVELISGAPEFFAAEIRDVTLTETRSAWCKIGYLPNGSIYVRWEGAFQFLVSPDGYRVICGDLGPSSAESFHTYLLGQALSFALVKKGLEPLHATCVVIKGKAIALVAESGYGKSTLAACFLASGYRLLTDDLLISTVSGDAVIAQPGPVRIKLFPHVAQYLFGSCLNGTPMNAGTEKLVFPLPSDRICGEPVPLDSVYVLSNPGDESASEVIEIVPLSQQRAFIELVRGTFNARILDPDRLKRQFVSATELAKKIPVKELTFPRSLDRLASVRDAILADLGREVQP